MGGVSGNARSVTFENIYSKANVVQRYGSTVKGIGSGGIVGGNVNQGSTVTIRNSVSASTGAYSYRITDPRLLVNASNVYELQGSNAMTNVTEDNKDRIHEADLALLCTPEFYTDTLGWSEEIWDFTGTADTGIPTLKFAAAPSEALYLDADEYSADAPDSGQPEADAPSEAEETR